MGTVGLPGQRAFFLQARAGHRLTCVALEKQQALLLAERLDELLQEVAQSQVSGATDSGTPPGPVDDAPLESPIEEDFRAGTMTLSWDPSALRVVVEVVAIDATGDPDPDQEPSTALVVRLSTPMARAFVRRARAVVGAGRGECPFCGEPLDPDGHLCVRANGFRRRAG